MFSDLHLHGIFMDARQIGPEPHHRFPVGKDCEGRWALVTDGWAARTGCPSRVACQDISSGREQGVRQPRFGEVRARDGGDGLDGCMESETTWLAGI